MEFVPPFPTGCLKKNTPADSFSVVKSRFQSSAPGGQAFQRSTVQKVELWI